MAIVLYPDGTTKEVTPQNGRDFKLAEIKVALGMTPNDMIAIVPTRDGRILVIDDEGKLKDLPRNEQATRRGLTLSDFRDKESGKLISFVWPGGYPVIYLDKENNVLCPDCANKPEDEYSSQVIMGDVYYEGPDLYCDDCNKPIESAYGDPDEEEEEKGDREERKGDV